ncbi:SRPBCC family protein [Primorskyibacter sp. S87]|uniref:SRPBCC family protein n=1 Tax=Primorskyibacter sp. S87 TaxID=3415126 RepID=UPI003C7ED217
MADLKIVREYPVAPKVLFAWISEGARLLRWWGPEGVHVPEHNLDFSRIGPWYSVMENKDGQQFMVSGHVTHVRPDVSVGFTWAWHDENGTRGAESHVTLAVEATETGARLVLDHRDLADDDVSANHEAGWTSSFNKLATVLT